ncbi:MAG: hypothetical protein RL669_832 [Pseudomonadota bacterium]
MRIKPLLNAVWLLAALPATALGTEPMTREFKLPLQAQRFAQDEAGVVEAYAHAFAALLGQLQPSEVRPRARFEATRTVSFLDTPNQCALRSAGFILRARTAGADLHLTLKTRSANEAWVRSTRVDTPAATSKLEEDVEPPARARLSRSATLKLEAAQTPHTLAQAAALFPALATAAPPDAVLSVVGGLGVAETVYKLPSWTLADTRFEAGLTVWRSKQDGHVLFVESDFSYTVPADAARARTAANHAHALFQAMQADSSWAANHAQTKTDFVYTALGSRHCDP